MFFGAVKLTRDAVKSNSMCNGYGIVFDGAGSGKFGNEFIRAVVTFDVNNSS